MGIYELLEVNREMRDLIARGGSSAELRSLALSQGFRTLGEQAIEMAEQGTTSLDEIMRVAVFD